MSNPISKAKLVQDLQTLNTAIANANANSPNATATNLVAQFKEDVANLSANLNNAQNADLDPILIEKLDKWVESATLALQNPANTDELAKLINDAIPLLGSLNQTSSQLKSLLEAFKGSKDILDIVLIVMITSSNNASNRMNNLATDLTSLQKYSQELAQAAQGLQDYKNWLSTPEAADAKYILNPAQLDNALLNSFKSTLTTLGGLDTTKTITTQSIADAMTKMGARLQTNLMFVNPNGDANSLKADIEAMKAGTSNPTSSVLDAYSQLNSGANAATSVNATWSAQLQGLTNNYQMLFAMATSLLQRMSELNTKITSLS